MATTQKRGRPRINLTLARKNRICREVALGKSLRTVLKGKDMPTMGKVMDLLQEDAAFAEQYARSKKAGIEIHIDGIIDLADTATDKNAHAVRLKVDTRKWVASKLAPKLYGDKIGLDVQAEVKHIDATTPQGLLEGARRIAFVLAKAARIAGEAPAPMKLLPHEVSVPKEVEVAVEVLPVAPASETGYRHKPFSDEELSDLAEQRRIERQAKVVSQTSYLGNTGPFRRR